MLVVTESPSDPETLQCSFWLHSVEIIGQLGLYLPVGAARMGFKLHSFRTAYAGQTVQRNAPYSHEQISLAFGSLTETSDRVTAGWLRSLVALDLKRSGSNFGIHQIIAFAFANLLSHPLMLLST